MLSISNSEYGQIADRSQKQASSRDMASLQWKLESLRLVIPMTPLYYIELQIWLINDSKSGKLSIDQISLQ